MKRSTCFNVLAGLAILSILLSGCASQPTATQPAATQPEVATEQPTSPPPAATVAGAATATTAPAAFVSKPSGKITATGFNCPEPNPRMQVTSKELNMFVWTEYIPQDIIDCFQLVYGIKINRDEFSSAEEQFAKLSKGNTGYDVAHVTDNVIPPYIRLGVLDKLLYAQTHPAGSGCYRLQVRGLPGKPGIPIHASRNLPDLWDPERT